MKLSPPAPRQELHTRNITLRGYQREDGLFEVEAHLVDTKARDFTLEERGRVEPGEPLHGMWLRVTYDDRMTITACEAATEHSPYAACPAAAPAFQKLVGLRMKSGFLKEAAARVGGTVGCTHLRELLQQVATTAFQTAGPVLARKRAGWLRRQLAPADRHLHRLCGGWRSCRAALARPRARPVAAGSSGVSRFLLRAGGCRQVRVPLHERPWQAPVAQLDRAPDYGSGG
jgi:hypothetical protein